MRSMRDVDVVWVGLRVVEGEEKGVGGGGGGWLCA